MGSHTLLSVTAYASPYIFFGYVYMAVDLILS